MGIEEAVIALIGLGVFGLGLLGARSLARAFLRERSRRSEGLEGRGMVYESDMALRIGLIIVWGGGALLGLCLLPLAVWIATGDGDAGATAFRMFIVCLVIIALGITIVIPGLRLVVLEPERLCRVGVFAERSVHIDKIENIAEARIMPVLKVADDATTIRISRTMSGFDDLFNRLIDRAGPKVVRRGMRDDMPSDGRYVVGRLRLSLTVGFLVSTFVSALVWPWFVVEPENLVRDSLIFIAIGLFMWSLLALLIGNETLQPRQPVELEFRPRTIAWRTLRSGWNERPCSELVSASVETTIIYVKGQAGYRYPLRMRFVGDDVLEVDDFRARHLGASTQLIGRDVRTRYLTTTVRTEEERARSDALLRDAVAQEHEGSPIEAVDLYRRAIAAWPEPERLELYGHVGDLLRQYGETPEDRAHAVAHYRAHIDLYPSDAEAWQGLAACISGGYRTDLADETIATAEQLLLSGRATPAHRGQALRARIRESTN